jgi:uncharacterized protein YerC
VQASSKLIQIEEALLKLKSTTEASSFLMAMLTAQENQQLRKRWELVQLRTLGMSRSEAQKAAQVSNDTANAAERVLRSPERAILDTVIHRSSDAVAGDKAAE